MPEVMAVTSLSEDDQLTARREGDDVVLLVKGVTSPHKLSGALLNLIREGNCRPIARAIGAGAVNQATKGCAIARALAMKEGFDVSYQIEFTSVRIKGEDRSAISFVLSTQRAG